ncbi:unnamed protein product [Chondrus crispus]|uniref:tRNA N(3)-methylcytidine methyltransferase n=1 Tax=Chondrus crispus TaxID=2769 RepID=R7QUX2_CHOCR|nr:unnamed protein product [Chondrus crispus]CDF41150.1 unnamed protein product [Chondrus crispus]|eukprot:XP_005711444.1 unnamed protein product [Chondrus crispus]
MDPDAYRTVTTGVAPFWASKYARESSKNWDKFYRRNKTNFYRHRHWTTAAATDGFACLAQPGATPDARVVLAEAGCGVANCAFPLLEKNEALHVYAFDFAPAAVRLVCEADEFRRYAGRCRAFVWDFCKTSVEDVPAEERGELAGGVADYVTLIFVLSAVPPDSQLAGLRHLFALLKPGGKLLFRDYATGDMAQARFANRNRIADNYFVRQDSTLSYFFEDDHLHALLTEAGFEKEEMRRVDRVITNRKEQLEMRRVFLQAIYVKPTVD